MEKFYKRKNLPYSSAVRWSRLKLKWPLLVWLGAIFLAIYLYDNTGQFDILKGIVRVVDEDIAPLESGRISEISVRPGDVVKSGDVVARLDTSLIDLEIAMDQLQVERQFSRSVNRAEEAVLDAKFEWATDGAELEVLSSELARLDELLSRQLIESDVVSRLRAQEKALAQAVALYPQRVAFLEDKLSKSKILKSSVREWLGGNDSVLPDAFFDGEEELHPGIAKKRIGLLSERRKLYTLRSHLDGVVSQVGVIVGEVVDAGEVIVTVVSQSSNTIVGFLPESNAHTIKIGNTAYISRPFLQAGEVIEGEVIAIGPEIMGLPGRVSPIPGQTMRGRRLLIHPKENANFIPGESVDIHITSTVWVN